MAAQAESAGPNAGAGPGTRLLGFLALRGLLPIAAGLSVLLITLIFILIIGVSEESRRVAEYRDSLDRSLQTRSTTWTILLTVQDAEMHRLAFLATGDRAHRDEFEANATALDALLGRLDDLTDGAFPEEEVDRLEALVDDVLRWSALSLDRVPGATGPLAAVPELRERMAGIRGIVSALLATENDRIMQHGLAEREKSALFARLARILLGLIALLSVTLAIAAAAYVLQRRRYIADLGRARQGAEAARIEAERANSAKSDFLASMSHEVRTPLNGIIGYADLLAESVRTPEQRRHVERIQFAGSALLSTVNDILDFSKVEAGQIVLRPRTFSLRAMVDNAASLIADQAERKGLLLEVELCPDLPRTIHADEARIRQVLLNLLNNAVKYTDAGVIRLRIATNDREGGRRLRFSVADTGIGIPPDDLGRLFDRFFQVGGGGAASAGTGLGLAISKLLVEVMGGRIGVESRGAAGSTFWFEVPFGAETDASDEPAEPDESVDSHRTGRILLVEDMEHNRDLAAFVLRAHGHEVDTAENGAEAVARVRASDYDLVLMDIRMPVMDGLTAARHIRALDPPACDVPIVALTANVLTHQIKMFGEVAINGHIGKPFRKADLLSRVDAVLRRRAVSRARPAPGSGAPDVEGMGQDWLDRCTREFDRRLAEAFPEGESPVPPPADLVERVHSLISLAGVLGHADLARACVALERALAAGEDATTLHAAARAERRRIAQAARDKDDRHPRPNV